jgi:hypothetical protein
MSGLTARHGRDDYWGGTGGTAPCGHEACQKETMMMAFAAMAPERLAFLIGCIVTLVLALLVSPCAAAAPAPLPIPPTHQRQR